MLALNWITRGADRFSTGFSATVRMSIFIVQIIENYENCNCST
ncbi:MAG: hypothetical protein SWX82_15710 [Cyanobacteriota bacterium]|nr:hypothetical protein [Cyanobacteriota bacterium]